MARHRLQKSLLASFTVLIIFGLFQNCGPAKVSTQTSSSTQSADSASAPLLPSATPASTIGTTPTPVPQSSFKITSQPVAENISATSADITWSLSDFATGQVDYGFTAAYGSKSTPELSFDYSTHSQNISGLKPGTTYHFRVRSTSMDGYEATSADMTFTTLP